MVEILTLFLGLVVGPHPVELAVDPSVAAVDLRLDGSVAARLDSPPWQALVDFGAELTPHELEAVALDAEGAVADTAKRDVNRPRPEAEAVVFLERDAEGRPVAARVSWETVVAMRPIESTVTLDGEQLEVPNLDRFALPKTGDDEFHFLSVDLQFPGGIAAHTQVVYGGEYLGETGTQLTAVPVVFTKGRAKKPEQLGGWFMRNGVAQRVVAVEKGPAEVIVVRAESVRDASARLVGQGASLGSGVVGASGGSSAGVEGSMPTGLGATASSSERNLKALAFGSDERLRLLLARSREERHQRATHRAFAISPELSSEQGGLLWALTRDYHAPGLTTTERIADAVAVAGMRAAWGNRRRAVVLALSEDQPDLSRLSIASVRGYLETLDVPLFVWYFPSSTEADASSNMALRGWPEAERIESFPALRKAVRELRKGLDEQRVVWLAGDHAPESIQLANGAQAERIGTYF